MRVNSMAVLKDDGCIRLGCRLKFDSSVETQIPINNDAALLRILVVLDWIRSSVRAVEEEIQL